MDRLISEQKAIEAINDYWGEMETPTIDGYINAIKTIPSAEPNTVLYSGDGYADGEMVYDMAECPNCGRMFEYGDETWNCNFCPDCGQALNWESEDKE